MIGQAEFFMNYWRSIWIIHSTDSFSTDWPRNKTKDWVC